MSLSIKSTRDLGFRGEKYAEKLLKENGYKIIQRNYYTRFGEIDILAKEGNTLVFVEVKLRKTKKYGMPEEAVNKKKLLRIQKAGEYYLKSNNVKAKNVRIDVVSILLNGNQVLRNKIIRNVYLW